MKITFRPATVEDCKMIREWIKINGFTRHWYYFDKIPRLSTLETKMSKKLKEPNTRAILDLSNLLTKSIGYSSQRFILWRNYEKQQNG